MVFEHIEKLKKEYTDKYVVVDDSRPELRRFKDYTGYVKTVNMNGQALVEFDRFLNIGWFDIDIDYLKIIDAPLPKPEPAKKAAPKKEAAKKGAQAKPAAKAGKAPAGGGMSVEEMLAAARGEKGGGGAKAAAAPKPKAEAPKAAKPAAKSGAGMSVEEMLAAARAEKSGDAPAAATTVDETEETVEAPVEETPEAEVAAEPPAETKPAGGALPTDTAGIIEYCRKTDA